MEADRRRHRVVCATTLRLRFGEHGDEDSLAFHRKDSSPPQAGVSPAGCACGRENTATKIHGSIPASLKPVGAFGAGRTVAVHLGHLG